MSDSCVLCDENVPRGAPHFVVDRVASRGQSDSRSYEARQAREGVMCGDVRACVSRFVWRINVKRPARTEFQTALDEVTSDMMTAPLP